MIYVAWTCGVLSFNAALRDQASQPTALIMIQVSQCVTKRIITALFLLPGNKNLRNDELRALTHVLNGHKADTTF
jgi:hypothetical protein